MTAFTIFPYLASDSKRQGNPYIHDMVAALSRPGESRVANPPHKNPLLSILPRRHWGDVFIFNWFESIPDFKYGPAQALVAVCLVGLLKLSGKKVIWVLHNKKPHAGGNSALKSFLARFIARRADLILTHATEGLQIIRDRYPAAAGRAHFLHHPTKNRLLPPQETPEKMYDLLIWGSISKYKGVREFLDFLRKHPEHRLKICVAGQCPSASLRKELETLASPGTTLRFEGLSFGELGQYIARSRFVLAPYRAETVLSSGILMDSLSFGAKVIGPDTGSFKDYAREEKLKVYTFRTYDDVLRIVERYREEPVSWESYRQFLDENDWPHFGLNILNLIKETQKP